ncbi:xanthine dehydrogenase molybdopterin binding subunit, partial [Aestuariivirga sp.]|uniref:xanthine dehydrogenase molybdopterin binding subunit n=1 Tax=Aestuariivirga sp. TaxID=2650926 RepID=UPI0035933932
MVAARRVISTRTVGKTLAHDSAALHVQGQATYVDDIREPQGLVHVYPGFAKEGALGTITAIDLAAVKSAPGVLAVLTAKDIPGVNDCSPTNGGDPILADGKIMFHGQVVFAVVADTRDAARFAARLGKIEIAAEKPAVTVDDAIAMGTHDVGEPYAFVRRDATKALAASPLTLSECFHVGGQEHFYLEGQVSLAIPEEHGAVTVHCSTQHPSEVQHLVAHMLHIPAALVTTECRRMGGAFGGKESQAAQWACLAALAAHVTGHPAKCRLDRDEDMIMTGKRHDFRIDYKAGFDAKGRIKAVDVDFLSRCGYSADLSNAICDRTMFHADNTYFYPAARIATRRLRTNTVSNTAFRGFGGPQGMVFAERMIEAIAIRTGHDPLDVRKINLYTDGNDTTPYGMKVEDNIALAVIEQLEASSDYRARRNEIAGFNARNQILRKGISLTPVKFGISFTMTHLNQAGALVHVYTDGSVHLNHGGTEMGQGLYTKVAQVLADEFQIDIDRVKITATTTAKVPNTSATAASSGSDLNGMAAYDAARQIKDRLYSFAAERWQVPVADVHFLPNRVRIGSEEVPFAHFIKQAYMARVHLSAAGFYKTPKIHWDRARGQGRPFFYYAYGASVSEVSIDTLTGEYMVDRADILHDVGKSLNPAIDKGQVEGAYVQGMGWLTTEELWWDAKGRLRTHAP